MNLFKVVLSLVFGMAAASAEAHVTVWPNESTAGARQKYEIRVPNEKQVDTVRIEVRIPAGMRVSSFEQVAGWTLRVERDAAGAAVGAHWEGKLQPGQFVELGLLATNPAGPGLITWLASQAFADGSSQEWSGPKGSTTPAPQVTVVGGQTVTDHKADH